MSGRWHRTGVNHIVEVAFGANIATDLELLAVRGSMAPTRRTRTVRRSRFGRCSSRTSAWTSWAATTSPRGQGRSRPGRQRGARCRLDRHADRGAVSTRGDCGCPRGPRGVSPARACACSALIWVPLAGDGQAGVTLSYDRIQSVFAEGNFVLTVSEGALGGRHTSFYHLFRVWPAMSHLLMSSSGSTSSSNSRALQRAAKS